MNANSAISIFFLVLLTFIYPAADVASAQDDDSDLKALDEQRTSSLRPSDGHLVDWSVIGPFSAREENGIGFAAIDVGEVTAVNSVQHAGTEYHWSYVITKNGAAVVDLSREFGTDAEGIAYAVADVYVNRDMNAIIRVETREEVACWINGRVVTLAPDVKSGDRAYVSPVRLRLGYNKVVIGLRHGRGRWSFSVRVLDEAGEPIDPKRLRILDDGLGFSGTREIRFEAEIHRRTRELRFEIELHRP